MPVGELLRRVSSAELTEWMAYARLEPWGEARADLRMGIVAATVANTARDPKRRPRPYEPADFIPRFDAPRREPGDWRRMLATAKLITAALGGEIREKR